VMNRANGWFRERLLLIGMPMAEQIVQEIEAKPGSHGTLLGVVDDAPVSAPRSVRCPLLGPMSRLAEIIEELRPDRVLVALGERRRRTPVRALLESCVAQGIVVEDAREFYERLTGKLAVDTLTPTSIVFSKKFGPCRLQHAFARTLSVAIAVLGLLALWPLFTLIALAIKFDSTGPVLFVQERVGAHGRPFKLLKFRTMHPAGRRLSEWECDNRDRVTRVGKWLRKFRLDEMPQFINVLRGEMNLVGPRPHPVSNFELFTLVARNLNDLTCSAIGYYTLRSMVRPGITGWAQVKYRYANNVEEEVEKLKYDLYYVKYVSAPLDFRILAETFKVMVSGRLAPDVTPVAVARVEVARPAPLGLPANVNQTHAA
jgi:lipopolysaccharide/colanic/teichoic acid biosynthesis glycosyltransferase